MGVLVRGHVHQGHAGRVERFLKGDTLEFTSSARIFASSAPVMPMYSASSRFLRDRPNLDCSSSLA